MGGALFDQFFKTRVIFWKFSKKILSLIWNVPSWNIENCWNFSPTCLSLWDMSFYFCKNGSWTPCRSNHVGYLVKVNETSKQRTWLNPNFGQNLCIRNLLRNVRMNLDQLAYLLLRTHVKMELESLVFISKIILSCFFFVTCNSRAWYEIRT